jgi:GT2 family glycosyltransferase
MQPTVYIIILNWNSWQDTIECLESVFNMNYNRYKVVVCDNNSQDGSVDQIISWASGKKKILVDSEHVLAKYTVTPVTKPISFTILNRKQAEDPNYQHESNRLTIIQTGDNLGFAGGNNVGLRYALNCKDMDYVWLLNNDTVVDTECLSEMVSYSTRKSEANICGSVLYYYNNPDIIQALGGCSYNKWTGLASTSLGRGLPANSKIDHENFEKQLSYISGASWLIPKTFLHDIGLMEESYFLYCEEIDWCVRNNNRYKLCYAPQAAVYHKEGNSIGSPNDERPSSLFSDFFIFRNKLRFTRKFFPEAILSAYLTTFIQALNRARRGQWDKALLILKIIFGKQTYN